MRKYFITCLGIIVFVGAGCSPLNNDEESIENTNHAQENNNDEESIENANNAQENNNNNNEETNNGQGIVENSEEGNVSEALKLTTVHYYGEGDQWIGEYIIVENVDIDDALAIHYLVEDAEVQPTEAESVGTINYTIEWADGLIKGESELTGHTLRIKDVSSIPKDEELRVSLLWEREGDNYEESFTMTNLLEREGVIDSEEALRYSEEFMEERKISKDYEIHEMIFEEIYNEENYWQAAVYLNETKVDDYLPQSCIIRIDKETGDIIEYANCEITNT